MSDENNRLAQVLRELMAEVKISEAELARKSAIPQPTLHRILTGATKSPRGASLAPIANFFSISINQLLGYDALPRDRIPGTYNPNVTGWRSIPILTWKDITRWSVLQQAMHTWDTWASTDFPISKKAFAVRVKGDAMTPRFPEDTLLILEAEQQAQHRDFVIALLPNQQTPLFKQYLLDGDECYLKSLHPDYRTIPMPEGCLLLGVLVQARTDFASSIEANSSAYSIETAV